MSSFKTLDDYEFDGKTVLVRADLNVPAKDGVVTDTTRLDRLAPTLTELAQKGAKVVIMSHFGRPKGGPDPKYSLKPVVDDLFTPRDPVCSAKGAVVSNISHIPMALTRVMALNGSEPDFAPRGDLSLKSGWSRGRQQVLQERQRSFVHWAVLSPRAAHRQVIRSR